MPLDMEVALLPEDLVDIILTDWKLPGMDGVEVACEIRKRYGTAPHILMISAADNSDIEER